MKSRYQISILVLIIFQINSKVIFCQNHYDFKQFGKETGDYFTAPLNWDKNDALIFGLISSAAYGLMFADQSIKEEMSKINENQKHWLMEFGRYWGEPIPSLAISGILLIHGYAYDNSKTKKIGFEVGQSFLYSVTVTSGLKIIFGRARPNTDIDPFSFSPLAFTNNNWSFPSGHTTVAFSLSTVLSANTDNNALKIVAFIPAFLTAISRVYQNYHWTSDVFLGAMIGYFTGKFITDLHKEKELSGQINHAPILSLKLSF